MVVLSLFDGMSCGQIALRELGAKIDTYYASEVDKYAIQQTQYNFPDTVQLGDVRNVDVRQLEHVDLLIGGSPCQSFSFAGKRAGMSTKGKEEIYTLDRYLELKHAGFEFEGQSYLFWEYVRILQDLRESNPNVLFLLENVEMGKKWETVLSDAIGIRGVHINSVLVSAQNRKRIYWSNIRVREEGLFGYKYTDIPQPADRGILLKDVLEKEVDERYFLSDKMLTWLKRHSEKRNKKMTLLGEDDKTNCVTATAELKTNLTSNFVCVAMRGQDIDNASKQKEGIGTGQMLEPAEKGKTNCLTTVAKDNLILTNEHLQKNLTDVDSKANAFLATSHKGAWANGMSLVRTPIQLNESTESGGKQPYQQNRVYDVNGLAPACCANLTGGAYMIADGNVDDYRIRRLTPTECARLQTIPNWYKWQCSKMQQYKMLGNGWTIEVIKHILSFLPNELLIH